MRIVIDKQSGKIEISIPWKIRISKQEGGRAFLFEMSSVEDAGKKIENPLATDVNAEPEDAVSNGKRL